MVSLNNSALEQKSQRVPLERSLKEIWLWLIGQRQRFHVIGDSMLPTLHSGEDVIVRPLSASMSVSVGDVVVCQHPFQPTVHIVKRVSEVFCDRSCYVLSDNAAVGTDSRVLGVIDRTLILGRVTSRLL